MITDPGALSRKYYTYAFLHLHLRYLKRCTEEIYKFRLPAATFALIGVKFLLEVRTLLISRIHRESTDLVVWWLNFNN